jgi:hypothetical protein
MSEDRAKKASAEAVAKAQRALTPEFRGTRSEIAFHRPHGWPRMSPLVGTPVPAVTRT